MAEKSEPSAYPANYPLGGTFADFLCWHMDYWGTRPNGSTTLNGQPWGWTEFRREAFPRSWEDETNRVGLGQWRGVGYRPLESKLAAIKQALFGGNHIFRLWSADLDGAWKRSKGKGRNKRTIEFPEPPPIPKQAQTAVASVPGLTPHFIGRDEERDRLISAILSDDGAQRAFLIQGGPGIGKTELTKAVAHDPRVATRFSGRRFFIPLETVTTAVGMEDAIIRAVGLQAQTAFTVALNFLKENHCLLILDNLETPWESERERRAVDAILAELEAQSSVSLIASFRGRNLVGGARWKFYNLDELSVPYSSRLFADIGGEWVLNDPHFPYFLKALGGLPLALHLVASRVRGLAQLAPAWKEWERIGAKFAEDGDFALDRLTSLSQSIEFSIGSTRVGSEGLQLFRILGYALVGLSFDDIVGMLGEQAYPSEEQLRLCGLTATTKDRISLLPPIREYAERAFPMSRSDKILWVEYYGNFLNNVSEIYTNNPSDKNWSPISFNYCNIVGAIELEKDLNLESDVSNALDILSQNDTELNRVKYLISIARLHFFKEEYEDAKIASEYAFEILEKIYLPNEMAEIALLLSNITLSQNLLSTSEKYALTALQLYRGLVDRQGVRSAIQLVRSIREVAKESP